MRMLLTFLLGWGLAAAGAQSPALPEIPACRCAAPVTSSVNGQEVYLANCLCPPQACVAAWSPATRAAGVSLQCQSAAQADAPAVSHCVDFAREPLQSFKGVKRFGSFEVEVANAPHLSAGVIEVAETTDAQGQAEPYGPHALSFNPTALVRLPARATRLDMVYVPNIGGGFVVHWTNGKGQRQRAHLGQTLAQHKVHRLTLNDAEGFDTLTLQATEHSFLSLCALR